MAVTLFVLSAVVSGALAGVLPANDFLQPFPAAGLTVPVGLVNGRANVPLGTLGVGPALNVPVATNQALVAPLSAKAVYPGTPAFAKAALVAPVKGGALPVQGGLLPAQANFGFAGQVLPAAAPLGLAKGVAVTSPVVAPGLGLQNFKAANFPVFPPAKSLAPVAKVGVAGAAVVPAAVPVTRALYDAAPGFATFPRAGSKAVAVGPVTRALYDAAPGFAAFPRAAAKAVVPGINGLAFNGLKGFGGFF